MKPYFLIALIVCSFAVFGAQLDIAVISEDGISSNQYYASEGDITNNLYCNGLTCTNNVFGNISDGNYSVNHYDSQYSITQVQGSGSGWSLDDLMDSLETSYKYEFDTGKILSDRLQRFFDLLSYKFVTRKEYENLKNNVNYLATQVDYLKAELAYLKVKYNMTNDDYTVQQMQNVETSRRVGKPVIVNVTEYDYQNGIALKTIR